MGQTLLTVSLGLSAVVAIGLAGFVWARREGGAGRAMVVMLVSLTVWNLAYAGEILAQQSGWVEFWGAFKYVGITVLAPSLLAFVLHWSGRGHLVTRRLILLLMIEPVLVVLVLAVPATRELMRVLQPRPREFGIGPLVDAGPLFWPHLVYSDLVMLGAVGVFVVFLLRQSDVYRKQAYLLVAATLLPWVANLGYNLKVWPLWYADLTPIFFVLSSFVLVWGLLEQRLLKLAPVAQRQVLDGLPDGVVVLDVFGHLVERNPAAERLLDATGSSPSGAADGAVDARLPPALAQLVHVPGERSDAVRQVRLDVDGLARDFEVTLGDLPDRKGHSGGRLMVLRDITNRLARERQLTTLLDERARVADTLSRSLRPEALPAIPGVRLAAAYRPAGEGREIGGDFYDVYPSGDDVWSFAIGDVSGKGASAAAVTALGRYSLRAFSSTGRPPARTLGALNRQILNDQAMDETYLTVAAGRFRRLPAGVDVVFALGGHPPPMLVRSRGTVGKVGALGVAIGLFPDLRAEDTHVRLEPGDSLVFYTDGVSEARRGDQFFGEDGLVRCLSRLAGTDAEVQASRVLAAVLAFQDQRAADDIAVLVIQAPSDHDEDDHTGLGTVP